MTRKPLRKRWPLVVVLSLSAALVLGGLGIWVYYTLFAVPPPWLIKVSLILGGLGALTLFVTGVLQGLAALQELRRGELPASPVSEDFPFRVIRDAGAVLPAMFGESPDPLADAARPYGPRRAGRDISGELRDALDTRHRVLVASVSGVGKTREIAHLASQLAEQGYTVLLFDKHSRLREPVRFPEGLQNTRNLLFVFDDLHTPCAAREGEGGPQPTFQDRLEDFLEQAVAQFGSREVSVLAAARTEQEQWAHLGWGSHPVWRGFHRYELPTPDGEAQGCFLLEAAESGGVRIPEGDRQVIVQDNDRTYRNLLENVRQARPRGELTASTFLPHKRQTFAQAYTRLQAAQPRLVPPLWAALGLLTAVGLPLLPELAIGLAARLRARFALTRSIVWRQLKRLVDRLVDDGNLARVPETGELAIQEELLAAGRIPDPLAYLETLWGLLRARPNWLPLWYRLADYAFFERGYARLARTICEAAVARQSDHLGALNLLGLAERQLGQVRKSVTWLERVLALARERKEREWEGIVLGNLGLAYAGLGEVRRAIEYYEQALKIDREIGDRRGEGQDLGNLGLAYNDLGETRRAIGIFEQALAIAREIGNRRGEGADLGNLGNAYSALGETRRAIEYHEQALEIDREIGDRRGEGAGLGNLGLAYSDLGETRRAIEYYEQALAIRREIGDRRGEGNDLGNLGLAYNDLGETRRAIGIFEQALAIAREIGNRRGEGADLGNLGNAYSALGETRRAIEYHEQALEIDREIGDRRGEGADLGNLGLAYSDLGETRRAIEYHEQALTLAREIGHRQLEGNTLNNLGMLAKEQGDLARARQLLEQALEIYEAIEAPAAERVRGRLKQLNEE